MSPERYRFKPQTQVEQQQREADVICQQLRSECVSLLRSDGTTQRMHPARMICHVLLNILTGDRIALDNREEFPIGNTTSVNGGIRDERGKTHKVVITTSTVLPVSKARSINVLVEGSDGHLVIHRKGAEIRVHGRYDPLAFMLGTQGSDFERPEDRTRKVSLSEAREWRDIVDVVKDQFTVRR